MAYIGARLRRKEDPRLLRGAGGYVADLVPRGSLHLAVLRSPYAHARITGVDVSAAAALPGVVRVATAADLPAGQAPIPVRLTRQPDLIKCLQYPLAADRARYVGDPVAVVIATDRYRAEDALELIAVEYDPLPPVTDAVAGLDPAAPVLHPALGHNEVARLRHHNPGGAPGAADPFAAAPVVLERLLRIGRHAAVPLEGRGLVARCDPDTGILTCWGPTKVPHFNRGVLADLLRLPIEQIRFIEPDVGGGFGGRGEFYPEDFLVPWAAQLLPGQAVSWVEDRREHMLACNHSRQQEHSVRLAAAADGTLLAFHDRILNDHGAYVRTHGVTVPELGAALLPGPYRIPSFAADVSCVLTNKTPTGTYRGPGRYEGTFVRERMIDRLARQLAQDPLDLRLRNMLRPADLPYDVGTVGLGIPTIYDTGNYPALLEQAAAAIDYRGFRRQQAAARAAGRYAGIGIGCFVEKSGLGPSEYARVAALPGGRLQLFTGGSALGQGMVTVLAQIAADALEVDPDRFQVIYGDTDQVPRGNGGFASRVTVVGGSAALRAAEALRDAAVALAARLLEADPADLVYAGGAVHVRGAPARSLSLGELARAAAADGSAEGLSATHDFAVDHMTYPGGAHICTVEVDPATGQIQVLRYVIAYDVGRAINPMLVEGQLQGGLAQGIGGALLEEFRYDEAGQALAASFMDYILPGAMEVPDAEIIVDEQSPTPLNPLGAKGAGEGGCTGAGACIANAVYDALAPLGIEIDSLPITPADLRRMIQAATSGS